MVSICHSCEESIYPITRKLCMEFTNGKFSRFYPISSLIFWEFSNDKCGNLYCFDGFGKHHWSWLHELCVKLIYIYHIRWLIITNMDFLCIFIHLPFNYAKIMIVADLRRFKMYATASSTWIYKNIQHFTHGAIVVFVWYSVMRRVTWLNGNDWLLTPMN